MGPHWRSIFDVIIVNAKKPAFFTHRLRHIREYRPEKKTLSWRQPEKLVPGKIYSRVSGCGVQISLLTVTLLTVTPRLQ